MKNKEIAFVVKYFPTVSETFIVNQINGLMDAGYKVVVYSYVKLDASVSHKSLHKYDLLKQAKYFVKPPKSKWKRLGSFLSWTCKYFSSIDWGLYFRTLNVFAHGKDAYTLKLFFEAQWFLVKHNIELIHAHFGMNGNRIAYLKAKGILFDMPLVTTFHGYDLVPKDLNSYHNVYAYLLKYGNTFTVNTPYLESLFTQLNKEAKPCYVLPVGLDTSFFRRANSRLEKDTFDLVFCGKLISLKGPDLAVEIVKRLHDKGFSHVRLHLIGAGNLLEVLQCRVADYGLQDSVLFTGALSQEELKTRFENADAFILPGRCDAEDGRAETQGLVIQEAQAMELPVVVSNVGGMKYGLVANETGYVEPEEDVDSFVAAIEKLILAPELKRRMGELGRTLVVEKYDSKVLVKQLLEIYKITLLKDAIIT